MRFGDWLKDQDVLGVSGPPEADVEVEDFTCDSREAGPGWAFAAL
jgi:hypothetical protein